MESFENKYDNFLSMSNGFKIVKLYNKYGVLNENDDEICAIKYDLIAYFDGYFSIFIYPNKYGLMNIDGVEVVACVYPSETFNDIEEKYRLKLSRIAKLKTII